MKYLSFRYATLWVFLLSAALGFSQIYLVDAPRFAEAGQPVNLRAFDEMAPAAVTVAWQSDTASGTQRMVLKPDSGSWTTSLPGPVIQGGQLSLTLTAEYDQGPKTSSTDCTIYIAPQFTPLRPQPLPLKQTILSQTKWNNGELSFGLLKPEAGPPIGPASITYHDGLIYILDTVKSRVLCLDNIGHMTIAATVPDSLASDLVIDAADGSLLVIAQMQDSIYRFKNGRLNQTLTAPMKRNLEFPAKFSYDSNAKMLYVHKPGPREELAAVTSQQSAAPVAGQKTVPVITEVQNHRILLKTEGRSDVFAVTFDQPVGYIDETLVDDNGIVWVLFTLQGDYRIRRLARIDSQAAKAETAQVNVWFAFDATRRMTLTDTGVALLAGDEIHGRVVMFDYAGDI